MHSVQTLSYGCDEIHRRLPSYRDQPFVSADYHGPARYFRRLAAKRVQRISEMTQNREGGHLTVERISLLPPRPWMPITADEYGLREHWLCTKREAGLARPKEPGDSLCRGREMEKER